EYTNDIFFLTRSDSGFFACTHLVVTYPSCTVVSCAGCVIPPTLQRSVSGCSGLSNISALRAPCPKVLASGHLIYPGPAYGGTASRSTPYSVAPFMSAPPHRSLHCTLRHQGRIFARKLKDIYGEN